MNPATVLVHSHPVIALSSPVGQTRRDELMTVMLPVCSSCRQFQTTPSKDSHVCFMTLTHTISQTPTNTRPPGERTLVWRPSTFQLGRGPRCGLRNYRHVGSHCPSSCTTASCSKSRVQLNLDLDTRLRTVVCNTYSFGKRVPSWNARSQMGPIAVWDHQNSRKKNSVQQYRHCERCDAVEDT